MKPSLLIPQLLAALILAPSSAQNPPASVPFVGCKADGQTGPEDAPAGKPRTVHIPAATAQRLAFYKGIYGAGVLAPRGWNCFESYGSSGSTLYVSPDPINSEIFFAGGWKGFTGPAIELSGMEGSTSGRFSAARTIARVFPAYKHFALAVAKEGLEPATDFPFGPYPTDKLTYRSRSVVEFETPPQTKGLGTDSWLRSNGQPIRGVAIVAGDNVNTDLYVQTLAVRLPPALDDLIPAIVQQVERDSQPHNSSDKK
jgi:hypothetical protein